MKVLTYTTLFPNSQQRLHAVFVKERIKAIAKLCDLRVVAPVPWFPPLKRFEKYYVYSQVPPSEEFEGLKVIHPRYLTFPKIGKSVDGWSMYRATLPMVRRIHQAFDFDLIDAHWAYPDGYAAILVGQTVSKPVSITIRGDDISIFTNSPARRKRIVYALNNAQCVIAVSNALRETAIEKGAHGDNITVIPNGVDLEKFRAILQTEARARLTDYKGMCLQGRRIILSVGRLHPSKGFHHIIDAIKRLVERGETDLFYIMVGATDVEESNYCRELEAQIQRLGMQKHVLLVGPQPHEELYLWYSACDLFCLASSREGWPNVLFEAFACGKPVVATRGWGGIPEVICSDQYGLLVEERNGEALARGIYQALQREWNTDAIIAYAQANTWDKVGRKVIDTFTVHLDEHGECLSSVGA